LKKCFRCGVEKPLEDFYPHPRMGDGRLGKCKECTKADVKANYAARRSQYAAYERWRNEQPARREKKHGYERRHNERHPDRYRARYLLGNAVRDGRVVRQPCEVCGDPHAEAHHEDYSRPLDVRWFCFLHHREDAHGQTVTATDNCLVTRIPGGRDS
jgi:hypothetical protein